MAACTCSLFRNSFPWLAALGSFIAFAHSSGFGLVTIFLTSSALILCPVIVSRSKSSSCREEPPRLASEQVFSKTSLQGKDANTVNNECQNENVTETNEVLSNQEREEPQIYKRKEDNKKVCDLLLSSSDALSDSESNDHTTSSEDSENDWVFREDLSHSIPYSDGSISDEESLIEIALPTGHYVDPNRVQLEQQHSWYDSLHQKLSDCSTISHFRHQTWMEMLNEMNEENLIEIDIGMGSIKCYRFEIEA